MAEKPHKRWPKVVGYPLFFLFALLLTFFLSFPYEPLKERIKQEADRQGYYVKIGSLGPGFFSVRATDVELSKKSVSDAPVEPLRIDSLSVGPALFPPGVAVSSSALGGSVSAKLGILGPMRVKLSAGGLDMSKGNMKGFTGVDLAGTVDLDVDLSLPRVAVGNGPKEPDLGQATGAIQLNTKGLTINGGSMTMTIPQFGPEPTPLDLPKIIFGDIDGKVKFDKGQGTVDDFKNKSPHLEFNVSGSLKLAKRLEYSEPNMEVRFKPEPEFQKGLGLVGSAFSMVGPDPKDPNWRMGRLTGFLGRPRFP
jgi:type II secretion system protein N